MYFEEDRHDPIPLPPQRVIWVWAQTQDSQTPSPKREWARQSQISNRTQNTAQDSIFSAKPCNKYSVIIIILCIVSGSVEANGRFPSPAWV